MENLKVPPHCEESERAVIGSMMIDKEATEISLDRLKESDFYSQNHAEIFSTVKGLHDSGKDVDIMTVIAELKKQNDIESVGGAELLIGVVESTPSSAHIETYCDRVKEFSILRSLIKNCTQIISDCFRHEEDPKEILEKAEKRIYEISDTGNTSNLAPISDNIHETVEMIESVYLKKTELSGIPSGIVSLDKKTHGFQAGNLIIIAARPGVGKTSLALDIIRHNILKGISCAFFSLEMTKNEITMRLFSAMSGIGIFDLRTGHFGRDDWESIARCSEKLSEAPLSIDCSSFNMSSSSIKSACRKWASKLNRQGKNLGLIAVDYLQLISNTSKRHDTRQSEVAEISRSLKALAIDLNVPIIAMSQLNRQTEMTGRDSRPKLSDLRESGAIEQDADLVLFPYREKMYSKEASDNEKAQTKLIIAKHRNGMTGEIDLYFDRDHTSFKEIEISGDFKSQAGGEL